MEHYTQHPRRQTRAQGNSNAACGVQAVFTALKPQSTEEFFH